MYQSSMRRHATSYGFKFVGPPLGPRQIRVVASDATPDRLGDILEPGGAILQYFRQNPIILAQHDSSKPIARCSSITLQNDQLIATIDFPDPGTSALADEYLALVKARVLGAVSVGFIPKSWEPIRGAGQRFTAWELVELSIVSVPANASALVTERGLGRLAVAPWYGNVDPSGEAARERRADLRAIAQIGRHDPRVVAAESRWRIVGLGR